MAAFTYSKPAGLLVVHLLFVFLDLQYVLAAASAIVSDVELLIVASTGARHIDAEPYMFWLGKVQRLVKLLAGGRRSVEYREPVDLDNYEGKIVVIAHWYRDVRAVTGTPDVDSVYVLKEPDLQCYDIAHVLAPVTLVSRKVVASDGSESCEYDLSKVDRDALDAAVGDIAKSEVPTRRARGASAKRKHSQLMPDDVRETSITTSARGRAITTVRYAN